MKYKINKKLFEQVTGYEGTIHEYNRECIINGDVEEHISINDFFFMCKEWATKKCIWISSWNSNDTNNKKGLCEIGHCVKGKIGIFESHTEQQAVFDACMYILDIKKEG